MAEPVVTSESVRKAFAALILQGKLAHAGSIQKYLGGGSNETVQRELDLLFENLTASFQARFPGNVPDPILKAASSLWTSMVKTAEGEYSVLAADLRKEVQASSLCLEEAQRNLESARDEIKQLRCERVLALQVKLDLEADLATAIMTNEQLANRHSTEKELLTRAAEASAQLAATKFAVQESRYAQLSADLDTERGRSKEDLVNLREQFIERECLLNAQIAQAIDRFNHEKARSEQIDQRCQELHVTIDTLHAHHAATELGLRNSLSTASQQIAALQSSQEADRSALRQRDAAVAAREAEAAALREQLDQARSESALLGARLQVASEARLQTDVAAPPVRPRRRKA